MWRLIEFGIKFLHEWCVTHCHPRSRCFYNWSNHVDWTLIHSSILIGHKVNERANGTAFILMKRVISDDSSRLQTFSCSVTNCVASCVRRFIHKMSWPTTCELHALLNTKLLLSNANQSQFFSTRKRVSNFISFHRGQSMPFGQLFHQHEIASM